MIFGRMGKLAPAFQQVFDLWNEKSVEFSALAHNLKFDDRVSEPREASLQDIWTEALDRDPDYTFFDAVERYKKNRVYTTVFPDFLDPAKNGVNRLPNGPYGKQLPPTDVEVVRVLELHGLIDLFRKRWVQRSRDSRFERFQSVPSDPVGYRKWLEDNVDMQSDDVAREFLLQVIELINEDLHKCREASEPEIVYPGWITVWRDMPSVSDPSRWLEVLGIRFGFYPRWVCLLKYPFDRAGTPVRPTQLDAGGNHLHFPTPGKTDADRGGHPMNLAMEAGSGRPPREFLHSPIRIEPGDLWTWKRVESASQLSLVSIRDRHLERLRSEYLNCDPAWMREHISSKYRTGVS